MKFGKKSEEAITDLRERSADTLPSDLGSVQLALEGSDLSITEDNFVPAAKCVQDTKGKETGDQNKVLKDYSVVYVISITSRQRRHLIVFDSFSEQYLSK